MSEGLLSTSLPTRVGGITAKEEGYRKTQARINPKKKCD